jgi:CRP-like cAMP-binding protein
VEGIYMVASTGGYRSTENRILSALPAGEYETLLPHLEHVELPIGVTLYMPDEPIRYVYFPNSGMLSLVSMTNEGEMIEIGMVSNEGMAGVPIIFGIDRVPYQVEVQIEGYGLKLKAEVLKEAFNDRGVIHTLLLRYAYLLIAQITQSAVCNRFHTVRERLCKWLLVARDRVKSNEFTLTQEDLSEMIGSHRPNVTVAARALQKAGLIRYRRGKITILDPAGLENSACECYGVMRDRFEEFLQLER